MQLKLLSKVLITSFTIITFAVTSLFASEAIKIYAENKYSAPEVTTDISIRLDNFNEMLTAQGTIRWDPAVLQFEEVKDFGLPFLNSGSFGTTETGEGILRFIWTPDDVLPKSLPDGAVFFTITFTALAPGMGTIWFDNNPLAIEFSNKNLNKLEVNGVEGRLQVIEEIDDLILIESQSDLYCHDEIGSGSLKASMPAVNGDFTYKWFDVNDQELAEGNHLEKLKDGTYKLEVRDAEGTLFAGPIETTILSTPVLLNVLVQNVEHNSSCAQGNGSIELSVEGTPILEGSEILGAWLVESARTNPIFTDDFSSTDLEAGVYKFLAYETLSGCYADTLVQEILDVQVIPEIAIDIVSNQTSCMEGNGVLSAAVVEGENSVTDGYIFEWFYSNGLSYSSTEGTLNQMAINLQAATWTVNVTNEMTACSASAAETILYEPAIPSLFSEEAIITADAVCEGENGTGSIDATKVAEELYSNDKAAFAWYYFDQFENGSFSDQPIVENLKEGHYLLEVTDLNTNCKSELQVFKVDKASEFDPVKAISSQIDFDSLMITIQLHPEVTNSSIRWFKGIPAADDLPILVGYEYQTIQTNSNQLYSIEVENLSTGCLRWYTYSHDELDFTIESFETTANQTCTMVKGSVQDIIVHFQGELALDGTYKSYLYDHKLNVMSTEEPFDSLVAGQYYIQVSDISATSFSVLVPVTISQEADSPVARIAIDKHLTSCDESNPDGSASLIFAKDYDNSLLQIDWKLNGETIESNDLTLNNLISGVLSVEIVNTENGCSFQREVIIEDNRKIPEIVSLIANDQVNCNIVGSASIVEVHMDANTADMELFSYNWYSANNLLVATTALPKITTLAPGNYNVKAINKLSTCQSAPISFTINDFRSYPLIEAVDNWPSTVCFTTPDKQNGKYAFTADTQMDSEKYTTKWFTATGQQILQLNNLFEFDKLFPGNYTIKVEDKENNCVTEKAFIIDYQPVVVSASITTTPNQNCRQMQNGSAEVIEAGPSIDALKFHWLRGNVSTDTSNAIGRGQKIENLLEGNYTLIASEPISGCRAAPKRFKIEHEGIFPTAEIVHVSDTLKSNGGIAWEWYYDGLAMGEIKDYIVPNKNGSYTLLVMNSYYCTDMSDVYDFRITSLGELDARINVSLYPNPTVDWLVVSLEQGQIYHLRIFDMHGRAISSTAGFQNHQQSLDVSSLAPGSYLLNIESSEGVQNLRFVRK
ncbi:MAG: T9SS type A sorting domain-containing protein [Cyclobacteriaceae bacterium]